MKDKILLIMARVLGDVYGDDEIAVWVIGKVAFVEVLNKERYY